MKRAMKFLFKKNLIYIGEYHLATLKNISDEAKEKYCGE